ncbi:hypothetical protein BGZ83_000391 [Gryganskiella cystojenkinii]|nr:hypothetical protein BGZ83_000391 [Gryganskiella cystojenkinii]
MDIPEICLEIAKYLNHPDIAGCSRVSKEWHANFNSLVYEIVNLTPFTLASSDNQTREWSKDRGKRPSVAMIKRHGHHIKDLLIHVPDPLFHEILTVTKNLRTLAVIGPSNSDESNSTGTPDIGETNYSSNNIKDKGDSSTDSSMMGQFLRNNPSLLQMALFRLPSAILSGQFSQAGGGCKRLTNVILDSSGLLVSDLEHLIQNSPHLTFLSMKDCELKGTWVPVTTATSFRSDSTGASSNLPSTSTSSITETVAATKMRDSTPLSSSLKIIQLKNNNGLGLPGVISVMAHSPELQSFLLDDQALMQTHVTMPLPRCPKLYRMILSCLVLGDVVLGDLMAHSPGLQELHIGGGTLEFSSSLALPSLVELKDLSLIPCDISSGICEVIRLTCPSLVRLTCPDVDANWVYRAKSAISASMLPNKPKDQNFAAEDGTKDKSGNDGGGADAGDRENEDHESDGQEKARQKLWENHRWACSNLQALEILQLVFSHDAEANKETMRQLSLLKELTRVFIGSVVRIDAAAAAEAEAANGEESYQEGQAVVGGGADGDDEDPTKRWIPGRYERSDLEQNMEMRWLLEMWPKLEDFYLPER